MSSDPARQDLLFDEPVRWDQPALPGVDGHPGDLAVRGREIARARDQPLFRFLVVRQRPPVREHGDRAQPGARHQSLLAEQRQHALQSAALVDGEVAPARIVGAPQDLCPSGKVIDGRALVRART